MRLARAGREKGRRQPASELHLSTGSGEVVPRSPAQAVGISAHLPVLIVEDDAGFSRLVATALEFRGLKVEQCATAETAVALLSERRYGLAIIDLLLFGGYSGVYVIDSIRKLPADRRPPVLIVTGASADHLRSIDRSLVKAVIFKPIDIDLFVSFAFAAHANGIRKTAV